MKTILLCALALAACNGRSGDVGYDDAASHAYRAAWIQNRKGDAAGYKAALEKIAADSPSSRAGRRAAEQLRDLKTAPKP
jgi:hypothetical protein